MTPKPNAQTTTKTGLSRRTLVAAVATAPWIVQAQSLGDRWPSRQVTIISPYNPGGTNDTVARLAADRLQKALGQPFVVENRPGAAGVVGAQIAIRAKPDGYTLMSGNNGVLVIQSAGRVPPPYDPLTQFTPLAKLADAAQFISVSGELPVKSVAEFVALAKREPGKLNYSSSGIGSFGHFLTEYFKMIAGIDIVHVPSKGSAAALTEMMAGRIQMMIDPLPLTQISDSRVRVLATLNARRFEGQPQIPTMKESGGPDLDLNGWFGLVGPAGLPQEVVEKISAVCRTLPNDPEVRKTWVGAGLIPSVTEGAAFREILRSDLARTADIRARAKIQLD
jgi:tripartite-type tricarboxylate transporter receptor subunit TctC